MEIHFSSLALVSVVVLHLGLSAESIPVYQVTKSLIPISLLILFVFREATCHDLVWNNPWITFRFPDQRTTCHSLVN
jgi:hypothetical protein